MQQSSFYIKTFGCQMNERDSEIMAQSLAEHHFVETMDMDNADVVLLNTCSIRAKAEQKVMSLLGLLRRIKKRKPSMKICVAGCVGQQEGGKLIKRFPHINLVIGTQNIYDLPGLLRKSEKQRQVATTLADNYEIPSFIPLGKNDKSGTTTESPSPAPSVFKKFVTIMQGCNNYCTYCVVPYTRGREVSRPVKDILAEVAVLVDNGVQEITLLGQNVNSYGKTNTVTDDGSGYSFSRLLRQVADIEGIKRLRFTTSNPKDLSDDLMSCFADIDILCPQFHLPVQSGSDEILKRMNRKYTIASYLDKVDTLRSYCPDIALSTDMIIGFPGETDADFKATMDLLEKVRYHASFSFKYSDRPGTRSSDFEDKVDKSIKTSRLIEFQARQNEISLEQNKFYIDQLLPVMIEKNDDSGCNGRTVTNHIVHIDDKIDALPGDIITLKIYHAGQHSLKGCLG